VTPHRKPRLVRLIAALLVGAAAISVRAQADETPLFRDLRYNSPISQFGTDRGYYDCSADLGYTARCVDDVKFLGHVFDTQILMFVDARLRSVQLVTEFKPEIYAGLIKVLMEDFTLIMLQSGERRLDLIELARKEGESKLGPRVAEFESVSLNKGDLTYVFIEQPGPALRRYPNGFDAITQSPPTTREADVVVKEQDKEAWLGVTFSLPRRAMADMRNTPVSREKF
jgi:hypothetical protein